MARFYGVQRPVIKIGTKIKENFEFETNKVEGKATIVETCCFSRKEAIQAKNIIVVAVNILKLLDCSRMMKFEVLPDEGSNGLYQCLLNKVQFILSVRGLPEILSGSTIQLYLLHLRFLDLNHSQILKFNCYWGNDMIGGVRQKNRKYQKNGKRIEMINVIVKVSETEEIRDDESPKHKPASHVVPCDSSSRLANHLNATVDSCLCIEHTIIPHNKEGIDYMSLDNQQLEHAVVGYWDGEWTQDFDLERYIRKQWREFGLFEIYKLKPGFFLFKFKNGTEKTKLLEKGQWFINKKPFILKRWIPNISLNPYRFLAMVPVWVRFPYLDLQFWSLSSLSKISSIIGKPLFVDESTAKKEKLRYARVCIEIDPGEKLPDTVHICVGNNDTILEQAVEYEWKPQPCGYCYSLYHDFSVCSLSANFGAVKDNGSTEDYESEDDNYSPTSCLVNLRHNDSMYWQSYYSRLQDMGLTRTSQSLSFYM